jgi:hypothetical protein
MDFEANFDQRAEVMRVQAKSVESEDESKRRWDAEETASLIADISRLALEAVSYLAKNNVLAVEIYDSWTHCNLGPGSTERRRKVGMGWSLPSVSSCHFLAEDGFIYAVWGEGGNGDGGKMFRKTSITNVSRALENRKDDFLPGTQRWSATKLTPAGQLSLSHDGATTKYGNIRDLISRDVAKLVAEATPTR